MAVGLSVIICTYNGAARIPETLKHLALQIVPTNLSWEVILIDNASTDSSSIVAKEEWAKYDVNQVMFKVLIHNIPGKNYAFQKGVMAASYEYVLTCDDDNWLNNKYVATAFTIMNTDSSIGALGGLGILEAEQPNYLSQKELNQITVNGSQTWATTHHWVYGAGSTYRKSIFFDLINNGWQQITTGRKGNSLICGEDVEICFMIYLSGYRIIADDSLTFKHFVPLKRQSTAFIIDLSYWLSYTNVLLNSYYSILNKDNRPIKKIVDDWFLGISKTLIKQIFLQFYRRLKIWEKTTIQEKIANQSIWGTFNSLLHNRKKIIHHHNHIKKLICEMKAPINIKQ